MMVPVGRLVLLRTIDKAELVPRWIAMGILAKVIPTAVTPRLATTLSLVMAELVLFVSV